MIGFIMLHGKLYRIEMGVSGDVGGVSKLVGVVHRKRGESGGARMKPSAVELVGVIGIGGVVKLKTSL